MPKKNNPYLSINLKISMMIIAIIIMVTIILAIFSYRTYRDDCIGYRADFAQEVTETMAAIIDPLQYQEVLEAGMSTDYCSELQNIADVVLDHTGITYLYGLTLAPDGQHYMFVFDGLGTQEARDEFGTLDTVESFGDAAVTAYDTGISSASDIYDTGEYGHVVSAFAPIKTSDGTVIGLIGADISSSDILFDVTIYRNKLILAGFTFAVFFSLLAWSFTNIFIGRRIRAITTFANEVADGNLAYEFDEKQQDTPDEISILAASITKMVKKLNRTREMEKNFTHNLELMIEAKTKELQEMTAQADAATKAKSEFLKNVSYNIKTPMNTIMGMSELLAATELSPKQHRYLHDMQASSSILLELVDAILDLSKMENGKLELIPVPYDFTALMDNISSLICHVALEKDLKFALELAEDIPRYILGDDRRLRQVLLNILENTVKAATAGLIKLSVSAAEGALLFDIQSFGSDTHNEDLVMALTTKLIDLMKGSMTIENNDESETICLLTIPYELSNGALVEAEAKKRKESLFRISAPAVRVLLVDDNQTNLNVAMALLELCHIKCDIAFNGLEAVEKVAAKDYDLILMDHMMPVMDGVEATARIRGMGGQYKTLPIIALTANTVIGSREFFLNSGLNDFLSKPIDRILLNKTLKKWLPPEKVIHPEGTDPNESQQVYSEIIQKASAINGLNVKLGLGYSGNIQSVYETVLQLASENIKEAVLKLPEFLEDRMINDFAIHVLGLKSALANIGHMSLAEQAKELEYASKDDNIAYCEKYLPSFLTLASELADEINMLFDS